MKCISLQRLLRLWVCKADIKRMSYLYKMIIDDIEDKDSIFVVKLPNTTTKKERICTAISESQVMTKEYGVNGRLIGKDKQNIGAVE
ncbi:hypothetical protein QE152_g38087 [Popillia japonica]|uniref:Ribosomal protein S8 n=1 Tax=Popillia japonica TaxID=7064 RepID=A0AAW1I905_POPJA